MQRKLTLTAVLAVALAITGYAQKTDFSGPWAVDQAATAAATAAAPPAPAGGGGRGLGQGPMGIKQTADSITLERQGGDGGTVTATYRLDGTEQQLVLGRAGPVKAKAKWDGSKIVIETTHTGPDGAPVTTWLTLQLDDKGMLWAEQKNPNATYRRVYKKTT